MKLSVDIIVINWNSGAQLLDMISSIGRFHDNLVESLIIVDNASKDGSLAHVKTMAASLPFRVQIVRNEENLGFGAACNQGARLATADLLLFLNPDACLFEGSLERPLNFLRDPINSNVGVAGIQLVGEGGEIARSCSRFPTLAVFIAQAIGLNRLSAFSAMSTHMSEWAHDSTRDVDHVIGAFYLMRRALFDSLGGFDERFFVYLEDLDLSLRVRQAGYRSVYIADVRAFHAGGGTSRQIKAHRLFYSLRSRLLYGFKHFNPLQAWVLVFLTMCIEPLTRTVFSLLSDGWSGVRNTWQAYGMLFGDFASILRKAGDT
ncbi:glycosyltransferase family 2 protein [Paraburkholderia caledonica]|uniref:glycosyltransferase family 2 protein n=1 Tax=Paraburkholderia caledonica TaxID=134536 RepID=UPI0005A6ECD4|nr:glycosyltransferase family 2 protein [Paraburkholderia caledonica]